MRPRTPPHHPHFAAFAWSTPTFHLWTFHLNNLFHKVVPSTLAVQNHPSVDRRRPREAGTATREEQEDTACLQGAAGEGGRPQPWRSAPLVGDKRHEKQAKEIRTKKKRKNKDKHKLDTPVLHVLHGQPTRCCGLHHWLWISRRRLLPFLPFSSHTPGLASDCFCFSFTRLSPVACSTFGAAVYPCYCPSLPLFPLSTPSPPADNLSSPSHLNPSLPRFSPIFNLFFFTFDMLPSTYWLMLISLLHKKLFSSFAVHMA